MGSFPEPVSSFEERFDLISRHQYFLDDASEKSFKQMLAKVERPKIAWETTPTGKPHVGYFVPIAKLIDFLRADLDVTVFYLDVYGFLVNYIHSIEIVEQRRRYYHNLVTAILRALGVDLSRVKFVSESDFAYDKDFVIDTRRMCAIMQQQDARDTCEEIQETKMLSPLLTSVHQALSEAYMDLDIQYGGTDQAGLFRHSKKFVPMLARHEGDRKYRRREHIMNTIVAGLDGTKMSSSKPPHTKIEFLDAPETIRYKILKAPCPPGVAEGNGVLGLLRDVLIPISQQRAESKEANADILMNPIESINGAPDDLKVNISPFCSADAPKSSVFTIGSHHFESYAAVEKAYLAGAVQEGPLKEAMIDALNRLVAPIRQIYASNKEWQECDRLGYGESQ